MTKFNSNEMMEYAFQFWFNDNEHIRTPFPLYIQSELRLITESRFREWIEALNPEAGEEIDEEILAEKFEQLLFESAVPLIKTEDERISILYPFLPRIGDQLMDEKEEKSTVKDRYLYQEDETSFLKVICTGEKSTEDWQTSFELTI